MLRPFLPSFFSELEKISEDLLTPAVVSDSATVDGPPAAPWTRRKGYRRLNKTVANEGPNLNKQAGVLSEFAKRFRLMRSHFGKAKRIADTTALKTYMNMPEPVQKILTNPKLLDPSDPSSGTAAKNLMRILGGG